MPKGHGFGELLPRQTKQQQYIVERVQTEQQTEAFLASLSTEGELQLAQWSQNPSRAQWFRQFEQADAVAQSLAQSSQSGDWVCSIQVKGGQLHVTQEDLFDVN